MTDESDENQQEERYYCYYCGFETTGRGMEGHVRMKNDRAHGSRGVVPSDYSLQKCARKSEVKKKTLDNQEILEQLREEFHRSKGNDE